MWVCSPRLCMGEGPGGVLLEVLVASRTAEGLEFVFRAAGVEDRFPKAAVVADLDSLLVYVLDLVSAHNSLEHSLRDIFSIDSGVNFLELFHQLRDALFQFVVRSVPRDH